MVKKVKRAKKAKKARVAVSGTAAAAVFPPYKCETTGQRGVCLKFYPDASGRYTQPPGGERVACRDCEYWFE